MIYWQDLLLTVSTTVDSSALLLRNLGCKNSPVNVFLLMVSCWGVRLATTGKFTVDNSCKVDSKAVV